MIRVTVEDLETGESETREIDDYIVITAGRRYISHTQTYPKSGTAIVTIKTTDGATDDQSTADA